MSRAFTSKNGGSLVIKKRQNSRLFTQIKAPVQKVERSKGRIFQIKFFLNVKKKSQKIMFLIY